MRKTGSGFSSKDKKILPFSPKERINHSVYGSGTLVEVNDRHTTIDFDEAGIKKFVSSMVQLTSNSTPAPEKTARRKKRKKPAKAAQPAPLPEEKDSQ